MSSLVRHEILRDDTIIHNNVAYTYLTAGNGVWVQGRNAGLTLRVPACPGVVRGLPELTPLVRLSCGLIPARFFDLAMSIFLNHPDEERFIAVTVRNDGYHFVYPPQIGEKGTVGYLKDEGTVLEMHSHGTMPAFFSARDDADEQGLRLYGVVGRRGTELRLRAGLYGYFMEISFADVFSGAIPGDVRDLYGEPVEWRDKEKKGWRWRR